ncbi:MAG: hypothetical protein B6245_18715 [Desulfobacteraceae bacterium 4572_88]|nr:MAG: hypothetical protein B6245_18715 [Desulfobacteraceae bacterium 4572_88]
MAMINMMVASENTSVVISDDAEADEMRSFVESRANQRWLRNAADHNSGKILAHTFGKREDKVFVELRGLPGIREEVLCRFRRHAAPGSARLRRASVTHRSRSLRTSTLRNSLCRTTCSHGRR